MSIIVYACDVGSTKPDKGEIKFGWARATQESGGTIIRGGSSINDCIGAMDADITDGHKLALGVESPLFLPIPQNCNGLSCGRQGDGARSCFAPAGGYVATLGVHQLAYILKSIARPNLTASFNLEDWRVNENDTSLLLWEAFVSDNAHCLKGERLSGAKDAATAAWAFSLRLAACNYTSDVTLAKGTDALSFAGSALLWAGWTEDITVLQQTVVVIRPQQKYTGAITIV